MSEASQHDGARHRVTITMAGSGDGLTLFVGLQHWHEYRYVNDRTSPPRPLSPDIDAGALKAFILRALASGELPPRPSIARLPGARPLARS